MDPSVLCFCAVPPALGAVVVAVMHLRKRDWLRLVPWMLIPIAMLLGGVIASNGNGRVALACVSAATLLVTVGLIFELRPPRKRKAANESPAVTE